MPNVASLPVTAFKGPQALLSRLWEAGEVHRPETVVEAEDIESTRLMIISKF